jgi:hypothetical protein
MKRGETIEIEPNAARQLISRDTADLSIEMCGS